MSDGNTHNQELKRTALDSGIRLFGVAEIDLLKDRFLITPAELEGLKYGICMAIPLSEAVLSGIEDRPTLLYKWHYRQANNFLDRVAFLLSQHIMDDGFRALPIPASQIVDWEAQRGAVSHRLLAEAAGLGWRGRNNLLVNETYGSQIRLVSILTDIPLKPNHPVDGGCGSCKRCVTKCPVGALGESPDDYQLDKCLDKLKEFAKTRGIGQYICGICVKACPVKSRKNQ